MSERTLAGKTALVTGAARGLGKAIAAALAARGANVGLADLDAPSELADQVAQEYGVRTVAMTMDVADPAVVRESVGRLASELEGVSVLVNNAGIMQRLARDHHELPDEDLDRMLAVHVRGSAHCAAAVLPGMRELGLGGSSTYRP